MYSETDLIAELKRISEAIVPDVCVNIFSSEDMGTRKPSGAAYRELKKVQKEDNKKLSNQWQEY